ncbi:MAG: LysM peptidoglycan-binding domain-containing protein [Clostridiales bacterium]|nr:LysM peptidoglycan-binding domain-containing protein [Clostridiales bacterium]
MEIYVVKQGDTLNSIANQYGVLVERLAYDNEVDGNTLVVGQALLILFPDAIYTIQNGDTLASIAERFDTTILQLVRNNSFLLNGDFLLPGRELVIRYANTENRDIEVFGYAYSYIRQEILEESCLYINELLPFSYGYNENGTLIPLNDERLLETAERFGNRKRMVLTPLDKYERFNNQLVVRLVTDEEMRRVLMDNVLNMMQAKGYVALDIDFEFIPGEYRNQYV